MAPPALVHTVRGTAGHVADVTEGNALLHGQESVVFADARYQGADKRPDARPDVHWQVAMRPGRRKKLDKANSPIDALMDKIEKSKAGIRAKVEHPFRVLKRQFGFARVRYRGLKKNTLQLKTLFALSNLWMARHPLMATQGRVRPKAGETALNRAKKLQCYWEDGPEKPVSKAGSPI